MDDNKKGLVVRIHVESSAARSPPAQQVVLLAQKCLSLVTFCFYLHFRARCRITPWLGPWQSTAARAHVSYSYQPGNSSDAPSTLHGTNASRSHDSPMMETESLNKNIFRKIIPVKSFVKRSLSVPTWRMSCGLGWRGGRFSRHVTGFRSSYWQMTEAHIRPVETTHFVSDDSLFLSISYYS